MRAGRIFYLRFNRTGCYYGYRHNLGKLTEVLETGANNVYEVTTPDGKTVLIPVIDQCILAHDMKEKTVTVHLLPGLLDRIKHYTKSACIFIWSMLDLTSCEKRDGPLYRKCIKNIQILRRSHMNEIIKNIEKHR